MLNTLFNRKVSIRIRLFTSFLIFALAPSALSYAQQPRRRPRAPQRRIITEETPKANTAEPSGQRGALPELVLQTGVSRFASSVGFSPDGRLLASMDFMAGSIKLWEVSTGRELFAINLGTRNLAAKGVNSPFVFSPDGSSLFSVSAGSLKQWDTRSGRLIRSVDLTCGNDFGAAYFSADARRLATMSASQSSLAVWDVVSGRKLQELELGAEEGEFVMGDRFLAFALSPNGRTLATDVGSIKGAERSETLTLRDASSGRVIRVIKIQSQEASLAPIGGDLRAQSKSADGEPISPLTRRLRAIRFTTDGRVAVAFNDLQFAISGGRRRGAGRENKIRIWDASSGRELVSLDASAQSSEELAQISHYGAPYHFAFSNDNRQCAVVSGNTIRLFDPVAGENLAMIMGRNDQASVSYSADGKLLATAGFDGAIKLWDVSAAATARLVTQARTLGRTALPVDSAAFSGDGRALAVGGANAGGVWDLDAGVALPAIAVPKVTRGVAKPSAIALNYDGSLIASAAGGRSIKINEARTGRELFTVAQERSVNINSLAWSADGRLLASSQLETRAGVDLNRLNESGNLAELYDYSIILWDAAEGRELRRISGNTTNIYATAFSPDSRMLASVGDAAVVKLWDTATGRELATLKGHSQSVKAVAFSSDGKLLVSGSDDGSARLWDVNSGEPLATLVMLNGGADWLVVTPDGLFDGTPGAWSRIFWRFSPNDIFDVAPVEIFLNEYFYPGLLSDIASGKRPRAARNMGQIDRRPPVLKLSRAADATSRRIRVKIEVSEPAWPNRTTPVGARDVRLFRNGALVKVWRGDALNGRRQATLEAEIPIVAGENRLVAYAFNRDNVKSPDAMLTVMGDESLRRRGVAYVIACGVNQYANPQYNLKYAAADATSFAREISAQQAKLQEYGRVEVITMLDGEATKANILLALKRLSNFQTTLPVGAPAALSKIQPAQPEDAVLIFFAGRGAAQGSRFYLIPHDLGYSGALNALDAEAVRTILSHGVSDLELEEALEGVDAGQMLFVLDACNSGQALEAEESRRSPMNSKGLAQLAYEKGMYILTAAQNYQAALEAAEPGHGYLTFALIEDGLKRRLADRDPKDGLALAREWFNYAQERVGQMQPRLPLDFAANGAKAKDLKQRNIQRPRVFYRRELESRQFVVAKP
jgi:WD40 repeat protein